MSKDARPPDWRERDRVAEELDRNMLVEAAAGTGKTTSMISRMVALISSGRCSDIGKMAAVTFTRKAAAELRARFQSSLEEAARNAPEGERRGLEDALERVEQCFIGTIHSFCGRLLRERPVEAGIDLEFEEIDEIADERIRREAWEEYVARRITGRQPGASADLEELGLSLGDLEAAFLRFADYPDVDEWPVPEGEPLSPLKEDAIDALRRYVEHMREVAPRLRGDPGNDNLIPRYRRLPRVYSHFDSLDSDSDFMELLEHFDGRAKVVQKVWKRAGFTGEEAKAEQARWNDFRSSYTEPLLRRWHEKRYGPVIEVLLQSRALYDEMRRERGVLNFQDLLMKASGLLRDKPHIRRYFRNRFTHLLVDEFQDTDPIQAEVMLLLTSSDPSQADWRRCEPAGGSLFVVGDPKQSIYRFRRADIVTYNEVKSIIGATGSVVQLSANFRSTPDIIGWVNRCFGPEDAETDDSGGMLRFPPEPSTRSPAYVPLLEGRVDAAGGSISGVYRMRVPEEHKKKQSAVDYDADRVARTIRWAIDSGATIPRGRRELEAGKGEAVAPDDFMIVTRTRKNLGAYAMKMQEYGIPHRVTGGSALNEVEELGLLHVCLRAVTRPDDPVALVAALRSELFGVSDAALYSYRKAGGGFSYNATLPEGLALEFDAAIRDAFEKMRRCRAWLASRPPVAAIELMLADLGLMALSAARPGGDMQAGSLAKALEVLREVEHEMWSAAQVVDYIGDLVEEEQKYDGVSARSREEPSVRLMNLHKVKGLQAPFVFLADPSGEGRHRVDLHVDRSSDRTTGYLAIGGRPNRYGYSRTLAIPAEWERLEALEESFLQAEELRLRYVAATRAGSVLAITQKEERNSANPWRYFEGTLPEEAELQDPGPQTAPAPVRVEVVAEDAGRAAGDIEKRITRSRSCSYDARAAKEFALSGSAGVGPEDVSKIEAEGAQTPEKEEGEYGVEWGTVIHMLLQVAMESPGTDFLETARAALKEREMDASLAEEAVGAARAVQESEIWRRALDSGLRLVEASFWLAVEEGVEVPTVVRGSIDLVFKERDHWVLVDYKTDRLVDAKPEEVAARYSTQVQFYCLAWEACTGEPVSEAYLYFTRQDLLVPVKTVP
jgi:ATP-dependent helicase/nuclease subunit A